MHQHGHESKLALTSATLRTVHFIVASTSTCSEAYAWMFSVTSSDESCSQREAQAMHSEMFAERTARGGRVGVGRPIRVHGDGNTRPEGRQSGIGIMNGRNATEVTEAR